MSLLCVLAASTLLQTAPDPLSLPIGRAGTIGISSGQIADLRSGQASTIADIVRAAADKPFIFLGEAHTNPDHHQFQAKVIQALVDSGRPVVVGFEMFTRPVQENLNPWTMGWWTEEEFIEKSDWKHQWGYDFGLYRPIFEVIRDRHLPMVALNIPRAWVHAVGTKGFDGLTAEQKSELPSNLGEQNPTHRKVFDAMIGGHPGGAAGIDNMYAAQVLWDQSMADSALKYMAAHPQPPSAIFVVIAGSGHVMYGQGINWRIKSRTDQDGVTVVMVDGGKRISVSRGLGDFVFCGGTEEAPK